MTRESRSTASHEALHPQVREEVVVATTLVGELCHITSHIEPWTDRRFGVLDRLQEIIHVDHANLAGPYCLEECPLCRALTDVCDVGTGIPIGEFGQTRGIDSLDRAIFQVV